MTNNFPLIQLIGGFTDIKSQNLVNVIEGLVRALPPDLNPDWLNDAIKLALQVSRDVLKKNKPDIYYKREHENPLPDTEDTAAPVFLYESGNDRKDVPIGIIVGEMSYFYKPEADNTQKGWAGNNNNDGSGSGSGSVNNDKKSVDGTVFNFANNNANTTNTTNANPDPNAANPTTNANTTTTTNVATNTDIPPKQTVYTFIEHFQNNNPKADVPPEIVRLLTYDSLLKIIKNNGAKLEEKDYTKYSIFTSKTTAFTEHENKLKSAFDQFIQLL